MHMHVITRISYNSNNWQRPTGDARNYEGPETYNGEFGFGHEDWLFRSEWLIAGWRYGFLQGVNKSHAKLLEAARPFDVTLYAIDDEHRRRLVATIRDVECLSERQAQDALEEFEHRGWFATMRQEIRKVGGDDSALGHPEWAPNILNIRFRLDNVAMFPPNTYAPPDHPIRHLNRYQLHDVERIELSARDLFTRRVPGSETLPNPQPIIRGASGPAEYTPEHARMQRKLMNALKAEYPGAQIRRESDFIDVVVHTQDELIFFEIKSDLDPKTVIRHALGQLLEYAYHPTRRNSPPTKLVIVGRRVLLAEDDEYIDHLKTHFHLPLEYRVVSLDTESSA
jgi:hypothetical protein